MPIVAPTNRSVQSLEGLHLYHGGVSNCSMRVRITLEEKALPWESHHFNILEKEHLTPEYFGINPKGLVPTLVDNGTVITESDDIIDYIDKKFPDPPLRPAQEEELDRMYMWLRRATSIHVNAVKTYIYDKKIKGKMSQTDQEKARYEELQTDKELLEFHRKSTSGSFTEEELSRAKSTLDDCFDQLELALADSNWIAGPDFSLADIAWVPLHFTLEKLAGYSFANYPNILAWVGRIQGRPSFEKGVLKWWPM